VTRLRVAVVGLAALALTGCGTSAAQGPSAAATSSPSTTAPAPAPVAAPVAAPLVLPASPPTHVRVPAIGVDSDLMDLGLQPDGTLEVPPTGFPAGWFTGSPTPGELGPAVLAGHVDWAGSPGVFVGLRQLVPGDAVEVDRADGSTARFVVTLVTQVAKDAFPTDDVYGDIDHAGLRLITCGGDFDHATGNYLDDVVVYADLVG